MTITFIASLYRRGTRIDIPGVPIPAPRALVFEGEVYLLHNLTGVYEPTTSFIVPDPKA